MSDTPEIILKKIAEAKATQAKSLDLSWHWDVPGSVRLVQVPNEIREMTFLEELNLSVNSLGSLPDWLSHFTNLTRLDISGNKLGSLPHWLSNFTNLITLDIGYNNLGSLPDWLSNFTNLTTLNIGGNGLGFLPDWLSNFTNLMSLNIRWNGLDSLPDWLSHFTNLTSLDVSGNDLGSLPDCLSNLTNLTTLDISWNHLGSLPDWLSHFTNLTTLNIGYNNLGSLPDGLSHFTNLTTLNISFNSLGSLPDWLSNFTDLQVLLTNDNQLKELPSRLFLRGNLRYVLAENNPLEKPPIEIADQGVDAIREYFRQLESEGWDYLYEAKLLIVGEPGAGKTTLTKKLMSADYKLCDEDSTHGIEVNTLTFTHESGKPFRINIWDFGGQEIYHATHQFFLSKRSLYILVADMRREDTDFYYWLEVVKLHSSNSPLLIVKNEKHGRRRDIGEPQLRKEFGNFKESYATNLADNTGLAQINSAVRHYISNLSHIGTQLPKTWLKVREALEKDNRNFIRLEEYFDLCNRNGFESEKDQLQLSGYLHDLGVCLHFQDDPLLRQLVILKPAWGTDAVYKILKGDTVVSANHGKFCRSDLDSIWIEAEYAGMRNELLQLMVNFKLCYNIPGTDTFIVPQLLTEDQPEYPWSEADNLYLRYRYDFMPKGIVTQLIVAMHRQIKSLNKQELVWKSGVVLQHEGATADVIEYYGRREIHIRASGRRLRELMIVVDYELDKIHSAYPNLSFNKLIPCNCQKCSGSSDPHFFSYKTLQQYREDRQATIECQKSYDRVDIQRMIDDVVDERPRGAEAHRFEHGGVTFNGRIERVVVQQTERGVNMSQQTKEEVKLENKSVDNLARPVIAFLSIFVVVIGVLYFVASRLVFYKLTSILIAGLLIYSIAIAAVLRQNEKLSEKSFLELMGMALTKLSILGSLIGNQKQSKK